MRMKRPRGPEGYTARWHVEVIMVSVRIFLIRHGATTLSAEDRFAGSTDVELSEERRRQAGLLGERDT